jgi:hypothetical protein
MPNLTILARKLAKDSKRYYDLMYGRQLMSAQIVKVAHIVQDSDSEVRDFRVSPELMV